MIKLKTNKEPKLSLPTFNVDDELHTKLNDYDITSLMNRSNFTLFLGKAGSGKSSLLISFLKTRKLFHKCYNSIYLFMPSNSRQSIKDSFFDKNLDKEHIYDDVSLENLQTVYDKSKEDALEGYTSLLIFDDVQKYLKGENEKLLLHMINNRRHARISIWMACQTYKSIPTQIRMGLTDLFVFKINKTEMENLFIEQIETHKDKFLEIINFVFKKSHDFLYLNTNSQRIFSNWNELLINDSKEKSLVSI